MEKNKKQAAGAARRAGMQRIRRNQTVFIIVCAVLMIAIGAVGAYAFLIDRTPPVANTFLPATVTCAVTETFSSNVKSNVAIQNTGNTDAYIRVALVSYLTTREGNISAQSAPALSFTMGENWVKYAGYYYYTLPVAAGASTTALIDSLSLSAGQVVDVIASAIQSTPAAAVGEAWGVAISASSVAPYGG